MATDQQHNIEHVREAIRKAFEDAPYPGDDGIINEKHCSECYDVARGLKGVHWKQATLEHFNKHPVLFEGLPLLKPAGFRFFVPAYMILALDHRGQPGVIQECIVGPLEPVFEPRSSFEYFIERVDPLTSVQKHAIRLFLEFSLARCVSRYEEGMGVKVRPEEVTQNPEASPWGFIVEALDGYWGDK